MAATTDRPWDGDSGRFTLEQWRRSCLLARGGDSSSKDNYSLPVKEPDGVTNKNALSAAAGRISQIQGISADKISAAAKALIGLYTEAAMTPPDHLHDLAGNRSARVSGVERRNTLGPVELRSTGGDDSRLIGGLASVFGRQSRQLEFGVEVVAPTFFDASRAENWPGLGNGVLCRFNHNDDFLLGSSRSGTLQLRVEPYRGLDYTVLVPRSREDIFELVQRGDVTQSSFAFKVADGGDSWGWSDGVAQRTLESGVLIDVAPVGAPAAYPDATVAMRSLSRFAACPLEDVKALAAQGELRRLLTRSDRPSTGRTMTAEQAAARLEALRSPPAWLQTHRERERHLQRIRARW